MEIHIPSKTEENNELEDIIHTSDINGLITKLCGLDRFVLTILTIG
ncbi:hypothetical protein R4Z09_19525 [Niallia oryzisoli]|uniref:Uncharacterized protein n=1 Tax=Niallia oryzisoli TaxID=1737571 RepID=A0ABZ2CEC2_9BACI